ncbi:MAG: zinc-dependent metalloprotease [Cytophagales bacterium]|nr:zinc-dependent metalloprotease [Cytophagales bacterium]
MRKLDGYFTFYYDEGAGRVFLEVKNLDQEFLYVNSLAAGIGSNDIGLDRNQLGGERVVKFEKYGSKLLLVQPNLDYRAISNNQDEVNSVTDAFAKSVLAGFEISLSNEEIHLIDITDFLLRDSHDVSGRLRGNNQGSYSIDKKRSVIYDKGLLNFPKNSEFEALLTFAGEPKDWNIQSVTPTANSVTVRTHHSFVELPNNKYTPRVFDPRSGFYPMSYQDYATPIEEPLVKRFIYRHRLEKKDPNAAVSEAVEPIIYYLDRGAPEPIRSALMEGASWWNQAFEAVGYKNAFQVKVLPDGAHPLDVRYNVINWVHRSTRGWSYGSSVSDPRTGEIIKGHVLLGSLRVRQDFLIATGLLQPYENGTEVSGEMTEMALARLRQLAAHEVGHTIGISHNFAASVNGRASVMDYPHPYVKMDGAGNIDLSEAYDDKIGAWDKVTIAYGYSDFPEGENPEKLNSILNDAFSSGLKYITDQDARPASGAHPGAHLWDNGANPADELNRMMKIRRKVLDNFSEKAIKEGMPMSSIEEVLVPMYLFHRFQVDATSKVIGGVEYTYAVKGDGQPVRKLISSLDQMQALNALLETLEPRALELSDELIKMIPPRAFGYPRSREIFQSKTGVAFDHLAAIETAVNLPLRFIFNVDRANRLLMLKTESGSQPGFDAILDRTIGKIWASKTGTIQHIVQSQMLEYLMRLAANDRAYDDVLAICYDRLKKLQSKIRGKEFKEDPFYSYVDMRISQFLEDSEEFKAKPVIKAPDGSPIGSCDF